MRFPFPWRQGEHMAIVGDTGSGKSTLASFLLDRRWEYYVVIRTKADDVRYNAVERRRAESLNDARLRRIVLDPVYDEQIPEIVEAFELIWKQGGWTVYIDELFYVSSVLKLDFWVDRLLTQGRSLGITVVCGMQRPVRVTRFALSQAKHVIAFSLEPRDARALSEATSERLERVVTELGRHEFVWFYRPTREYWVGKLQDLGGEV